MKYQDFYRDCIPLYNKYPGMPVAAYQKLDGSDQRRLHLAAVALLQTLDLAHRAGDSGRAANIEKFLADHEGPLITDGAIRFGALASINTLHAWNRVRERHGRTPLTEPFLLLHR